MNEKGCKQLLQKKRDFWKSKFPLGRKVIKSIRFYLTTIVASTL